MLIEIMPKMIPLKKLQDLRKYGRNKYYRIAQKYSVSYTLSCMMTLYEVENPLSENFAYFIFTPLHTYKPHMMFNNVCLIQKYMAELFYF